jgi:hypothetical protein
MLQAVELELLEVPVYTRRDIHLVRRLKDGYLRTPAGTSKSTIVVTSEQSWKQLKSLPTESESPM